MNITMILTQGQFDVSKVLINELGVGVNGGVHVIIFNLFNPIR